MSTVLLLCLFFIFLVKLIRLYSVDIKYSSEQTFSIYGCFRLVLCGLYFWAAYFISFKCHSCGFCSFYKIVLEVNAIKSNMRRNIKCSFKKRRQGRGKLDDFRHFAPQFRVDTHPSCTPPAAVKSPDLTQQKRTSTRQYFLW